MHPHDRSYVLTLGISYTKTVVIENYYILYERRVFVRSNIKSLHVRSGFRPAGSGALNELSERIQDCIDDS